MLPQSALPPSPTPPRDNAFRAVWRNPYVRAVVFVLLIYVAYRFWELVTHVVVLAVIAYIIAYLANPALTWLSRRRVPRGVGALLVILIIFGMLALASTLLVTIGGQFYDLVRELPTYATQATGYLNGLTERYTFLEPLRKQLTNFTQNGAQTISQYVLPYVQRYSAGLVGGLFGVASTVAELFAVLILAIYMMLDYDKIGLTLLRAFPRPWQPFVLDLSRSVNTAVGGYLRGQLLIALFVGVFVGLGLALIGVPSAAALGFLAGAFNIVPYLGVIIGITPALLLAIPLGLVKVVLVVVVFVAANQIEGHVLSPIVLGRTTNLHPVTVVIAILTGVALMGITGALLAVPLAALGKLLMQEYYYPSRTYKDGP